MDSALPFVIWLGVAGAAAWIAHVKGRRVVLWFLIGLGLNIFSCLLLWVLPRRDRWRHSPNRHTQGRHQPQPTLVPYNALQNKKALHDMQQGRCNGCGYPFPLRNLTVDHIVPQIRGGSDQFENLQLLCPPCNSTKGTGTQAQMWARLEQKGIHRHHQRA